MLKTLIPSYQSQKNAFNTAYLGILAHREDFDHLKKIKSTAEIESFYSGLSKMPDMKLWPNQAFIL